MNGIENAGAILGDAIRRLGIERADDPVFRHVARDGTVRDVTGA